MKIAQQIHMVQNSSAPRCSACKMLALVDDEDREAITAALLDKRISDRMLSDILRENGYQISRWVLVKHRGECMTREDK